MSVMAGEVGEEGDGGENPWRDIIVKSGLLAIVSSWLRSMAKADVKTKLSEISTLEECKIAKKALIDAVTKEDLEKMVGSVTMERKKIDLSVNVIVTIIGILMDKNLLPTFIIQDTELDKYVTALAFDTARESRTDIKMASMENKLKELTDGQNNLFELFSKLSQVQPVGNSTLAGAVGKQINSKGNASLKVPNPFPRASDQPPPNVTTAKRSFRDVAVTKDTLQPPRKRANSVFSIGDESEEERSEPQWETTRQEKRRVRTQERKQNEKIVQQPGVKKSFRKPTPVVVGTGKAQDEKAKAFTAAPKHVFVKRVDRSVTKELVEECLKLFANVDGKAVLVTPEEYRETAYSFSWRVEVPAADLEKALKPDSWAEGWEVRPFYFTFKKKNKEGEDSSDRNVTSQRRV